MSIGEQRQVVEKKIESITRKKTLFGDLFRTLLHQLMSAQIRVDDLDLPEISERIDEQGLSPCVADDRS